MRPHLDVSLSGVLDASIHQCAQCGFCQVRPRLGRQELALLYPAEYFDSASSLGFRNYSRQQQRYEREAYFLARQLRKIAPQGRLLEVGCALGFLLEALRHHTTWEMTGIDVSPFGIFFARRSYGLDARCATLEEVRFPENSFDAIIQKDLLEHVLKPREHLLETCRILRPGGRLWLITPNGEANLRPLRHLASLPEAAGGRRLPLLEQGHLSFFSRQHLLGLFCECGFVCVRMRSINVRRGLRALGYLPRKKKSLKTAAAAGRRVNPTAESEKSTGVDLENDPQAIKLYEQIREEVERQRSPLRRSIPYFYFRHVLKTLDSLPGSWCLGNDFECTLLKK